jgi:hypothetical protein
VAAVHVGRVYGVRDELRGVLAHVLGDEGWAVSGLVVEFDGQRWWVRHEEGEYIDGPFATNAEAWRCLDRQEGEPISSAEKVTDWLLKG